MKYIIGLGNLGEKYKYTRHNIAWLIFDSFNLDEWKYDKYMNALFVSDYIKENMILYIKPETFMNRSGDIVPVLKRNDNFSSKNIIILHDDIDLEFGKVRISFNRGDGGHNGVKSIIKSLNTKKIIRIRVGISKINKVKESIIKPNVLSNFSKEEQLYIKEVLSIKIKKIIKSIVLDGLEKTMNTYN